MYHRNQELQIILAVILPLQIVSKGSTTPHSRDYKTAPTSGFKVSYYYFQRYYKLWSLFWGKSQLLLLKELQLPILRKLLYYQFKSCNVN